jgi:hypothetical protein
MCPMPLESGVEPIISLLLNFVRPKPILEAMKVSGSPIQGSAAPASLNPLGSEIPVC